LKVSATKILPSLSTAIPEGKLNFAVVPLPLTKPLLLPAKVVTRASIFILIILVINPVKSPVPIAVIV
jgi:hypothetical protein